MAMIGLNTGTLLIYGLSFIVVIWCVVDVTRRPTDQLPRGKKVMWLLASLLGWFLFGIIGEAIAVFYLVGPRRRMNAQRR
jgi:hypothetical protein